MKLSPMGDQQLNNVLAFLHTQAHCVYLETSKTNDGNQYSYIFHDPIALLHFGKEQSLAHFCEQAQTYLNQDLYLAGWFNYEFGYALEPSFQHLLQTCPAPTLATLGVFKEPIIYDHKTATFSGPLPPSSPFHHERDQADGFSLAKIHPNMDQETYLNCLQTIKNYIEAGDTYQVNFTLKLLFEFNGNPETFYSALRRSQPVSYAAFIKLAETNVLSFSPELFFQKDGNNCQVKPMKGTIGRGMTLEEDQQLAETLKKDSKNRSENVMILDLLRNDLGRLCSNGGVQTTSMFDVEAFTTLQQMTSTVTGRLRPNITLQEIFKALFPCGSVTGAPKIRTMEIISELEAGPRGIYTGAIGFIGPRARKMIFNVPIRTIVVDGNQAEMGIGSGITYDSSPEDEWQECLLKAKFLTSHHPDFQLIETILWTAPDGFYLLALHLKRLCESAAYFNFHCDEKEISQQLNTLLPVLNQHQAVRVRLLLYRDGTLELSTTPCNAPQNLFFPTPLPQDEEKLPHITISRQATDSRSAFFYHKTTHRALYTSERDKALNQNFVEVLFENERGEMTEGSISTLFIRKNTIYFTPPVNCALLAGTLRQHLLTTFPGQVQEALLTRADLETAEAIFIANSVRGIIQVRL